MVSRFYLQICFFLSCFLLCACDDVSTQPPKEEVVAKPCTNPKIQAELAGNILEFSRDESQVWIENPDKADKIHRYIDVSQDCLIVSVEDTFRVALGSKTFNMPLRLSLSSPNASNHDYLLGHLSNKTYEEIFKEYKDIIEERPDGVLQISFEDERGKTRKYLIVQNHPEYSLNGDPVVFLCKKWQGCSAKYLHPSGIEFRFSINPFFKKPDALGLLKTIHSTLEPKFINQKTILTGEQ